MYAAKNRDTQDIRHTEQVSKNQDQGTAFHLADNRPEALQIERLQKIANNSSQANDLTQFLKRSGEYAARQYRSNKGPENGGMPAQKPLQPTNTIPPSPVAQRRRIHSAYHGDFNSEDLTREEIVSIYKQLKRIGGDKSTIQDLVKAMNKGEYDGFPIDVDSLDEMNRSLSEIITINKGPDHSPDLDAEHTVGLEVEFGYHQNPLLNFTHIELARSKKRSRINDLPFKLETDSGSTVEIVTPPLWMAPEEEAEAQADLESFAKASVSTPLTIAQWVAKANATYPMELEPVPEQEIRTGVNKYNVDEGVDIKAAVGQSKRETLRKDIGDTLLSPSQKDPTGAHTQRNKAISIAEYGKSRSDLYEKIRNDLASFSSDPEFPKMFLTSHGLWDDALGGPHTDVNAINAMIFLAKRKHAQQPPDTGSAAYMWQSHMQCVARIFSALARPLPEKIKNPFGAEAPDNTGPICTLIGEKSVTGALASIGENFQFMLQEIAWEYQDPSVLKVQETDSLTVKKVKAMASWHSSVKDITGSWFKGDLKQVLLNELVQFSMAKTRGQLRKAVIPLWKQQLPALMAPYLKTLEGLGVTVQGQRITAISDAWLKLPIPDPLMYIQQWEATINSICDLIQQVMEAKSSEDHTDYSFSAPGFLKNFNTNLYNGREDTMISSQHLVRFPQGTEHRYVVEKR
ncbi:hypothetical protein [Dawidia soli]|uniref:Uncharacterized protein n=1 Tax=Dawidia soli TaxID=2782352 RepID=A0AAP2DD20_9BACT|nr:hypothetical protein [Dawidia soli]MBT1688500.1 hypothetical protein [Dawidia soli]